MSITHAEYTPQTRKSLTEGLPLSAAIISVGGAVSGLIARLTAACRHRLVMRRFARFSSHRLQDVGYERDWNGSIIPVTPDPRLPWSKAK